MSIEDKIKNIENRLNNICDRLDKFDSRIEFENGNVQDLIKRCDDAIATIHNLTAEVNKLKEVIGIDKHDNDTT